VTSREREAEVEEEEEEGKEVGEGGPSWHE